MHHQEPPSSPIVLAPRTIIMALIILGSALLLWQVKSTILVILLAIVIASFVDGGVRMFQRIHVPRYLAVIIIYLSGVLLLGFFLYAFIPVLLDELLALLQLLPEDAPFAEFLASLGDSGLREALTQLTSNPDMNPFEVIKMIRSEISAFNIIEGLGVFFGGMVNVVLVVVISFYLSMIDDGVGKFLRIVTPLQHEEYVIGIWERSRLKIGGWFRGQVFLAIIEGSLTYIGLLIIGVPYALILGILAFFFSLIPYGVMLSGFLAVVVAFLTGGIPMALTTFLFILLLQQVETYVWQPLIIHSVTGVPSLIIIISLVIGAQLAGLMGLLLAVPVAVVILEIVHDTEQKRFALMQQQHTMFDNSSE